MNGSGLEDASTRPITSDSEPRYVLGVFAFICFTLGLSGNCLVLAYFVSKFRSGRASSTIVYIFISGTDMLLCFLIVFSGVSDFTRQPTLYRNQIVCNVWGVLWNATTRLSVFLVGILSLSRTLSFVFPLNRYFSKLAHFIVPIGTYTTIQIIQATVPFWANLDYMFSGLFGICTYYLDFIYDVKSWEYKSIMFIIVDLEILIPFFIIFISCGISIHYLRRDMNTLHATTTPTASCPNNKLHASITITILTCVYLVLNIPSCVVYILYAVSRFTNGTFKFWLYIPAEFEVFAAMHFVPINSTANLIVYLIRMKSLQKFIWKVFLKAKYCITLNLARSSSLKLSRDVSIYSNQQFYFRDHSGRRTLSKRGVASTNACRRGGSITIDSDKAATVSTSNLPVKSCDL